jgi:ubiquitin-activating enzyme E1
LRESLVEPEFLISDFGKFDRPAQLHLAFQAVDHFLATKSYLPRPHNAADAREILAFTKKLSKDDIEIDEKIIEQVSFQATGNLSPMIAVFGGWGAQEVLKAVSGKFGPTFQWLYFDSLESLPSNDVLNEETCKPVLSFLSDSSDVF